MDDRGIISAIQKLAGTFKADTVILISATVKSVDEDEATCVCVAEGDVEIPNVLLQNGVCDGLMILPVVDSSVYILTSKYNKPFIVQYSDVDKFYLQVKDSKITVTNDGNIEMNDGSYGGLIQIKELVKKINALEDKHNNLCTYVGGLPIPVSGAVSGPAVPANTIPFQINPTTQQSDIENTKITHGK